MLQQPPQGVLVVDVRTAGRAVDGADVRAEAQETRTDVQGRARLSLPPGTWAVTVSAEAFHNATINVRIDAGQETHVEAELTPRITSEERVIVTAARTERRLEDQPVRIEVIDREDIEEKALMTPGSVAMLLGETTGLRVETTAPRLRPLRNVAGERARCVSLDGSWTRGPAEVVATFFGSRGYDPLE